MNKQFTEEYIKNLYNTKIKLPASYFKKYEYLPPCPLKSRNYNWGNHDYPRNMCILDFIEWITKYNITANHLGCTCNSDPELEFLNYNKKTLISYPQYDLHTISKDFTNEFDFFLFE